MVRPVAPRRVPNRSCVACRTVRPKRELLRVVRTPNGRIEADPGGRLAGRGAYVCRASECIDNAIKKGALTRALGTSIPAEVRDELVAAIADPTSDAIQGGDRGQE